MRFCLDFSQHPWQRATDLAAEARRTVAMAAAADAAGIDAIWATEDPDAWDAFALLGAFANVTSHALLGPGVTNPYHRHPNLIAASVATLDALSGGRAVLGLGRGQPEWYERRLGMEIGDPLAALRETIALVRQWWVAPYRATSAADHSHFAIRDWERVIHPIQTTPPIYIAAAGPKALALSGAVADGVIFNSFASDPYLKKAIADVRTAARGAGRDPSNLAFILRTQIQITDDSEPILQRAKQFMAVINALPGMDRLIDLPGYDVPRIVAELRRAMRTEEVLAGGGAFAEMRRVGDLDAARKAIPTAMVAELAIAGPIAHIRTRLAALAKLGVTHLSIAPPGSGTDVDEYRDLLRELHAATGDRSP